MRFDESIIHQYGMTQKELELTQQSYFPEHIKAKSHFLKQGKISDKIAFVLKGLLRSYKIDEEGNDVTTQFHPAGTLIISFDSFNDRIPAKENIISLVDSELLVITHSRQMELYRSIPVWQQICKDHASRASSEQLERVYKFQTLNAFERYQAFCNDYPDVLLKSPLKHIASFLGIDIATLSRIRSKR